MKKLCFLSALTLTACGGGDSGTESKSTVASAPPPTPVVSQEVVYYKELKNAIPSLSLYYNKTCNNKANSFMLPTIDANKDGREDLFIVLWCEAPQFGGEFTGPVTNTVISLLQNNDGSFRLGNQEVFGKDYVEITGVMGEGADVGIGDFNGDGKEDIAFSPVLEDGRKLIIYADGSTNWDSNPVVFLSQANGPYNVQILGTKGMYESLAIVKGTDRDKFITGGKVWSYENNQWSGTPLKYKADRTSIYFDNYMTMSVWDGKSIGWQIGTIDSNQNYTQTQYLHLSDLRTVMVYNDQLKGDTSENLATIDSVDYIKASFNSVCTIPGNSPSDFTIIAEFQGLKLQEKYTGQKLEWTVPGKNGNIDWSNYITHVIAYKVSNGKLSKVDVPAFSKDITNGHYVTCLDMNADNKKDVVVYRWGHKQEKSVIFLANNNGFVEVPENKIPEISTVYHGHNVLASDLDNDGKTEILYGPGLGYKPEYKGLYDDYQIYKPVSLL
jgi:hypothetical protein